MTRTIALVGVLMLAGCVAENASTPATKTVDYDDDILVTDGSDVDVSCMGCSARIRGDSAIGVLDVSGMGAYAYVDNGATAQSCVVSGMNASISIPADFANCERTGMDARVTRR